MYYDAFVSFSFSLTTLVNKAAHKALDVLVYSVSFVWFLALYAYLESQKPRWVLTALYTDAALEAKEDLGALTVKELKALLAKKGLKAPTRALVELLVQGA